MLERVVVQIREGMDDSEWEGQVVVVSACCAMVLLFSCQSGGNEEWQPEHLEKVQRDARFPSQP